MFQHRSFADHEQVVHVSDPAVGLRCIIAMHSTRLGPAIGGCRVREYGSEDEALDDVLRLSRGMTMKAAVANVPFGGGKMVVLLEPGQSGEIIWRFPDLATLEFACNVPGHYQSGMVGRIQLSH